MTKEISNGVKKNIFTTIGVMFFTLLTSGAVFAQGMMGDNVMGGNNTVTQSGDGHTAREEAEGKEIWEKLQAEELKCENLTDDNFGALGEYFMGQMAGEQHEAMNNMMIQMIGADGEKQMHIAMGKRMSNCEPNAPMPQNMMGGGATNPTGWFGWGFSWIFMILFLGFIILAIVALIKWVMNQGKHGPQSQSAFPPKADPPRAEDILKERYAKGEIDKKEFEEKKKDLI